MSLSEEGSATECEQAIWQAVCRLDGILEADAWANSIHRHEPLIFEHQYADLRDGLYGRAGQREAARLLADYPELARVPEDPEHAGWILLRSIAILAGRTPRRFAGEPPAFELADAAAVD